MHSQIQIPHLASYTVTVIVDMLLHEADSSQGGGDGMADEQDVRLMTVNEVVKIAGVSKRTLQYYDSIGLLSAEKRTKSGYRLFSEESLEILKTIAHYKSMGFELKEIKEILYTEGYDIVSALKRKREQLKRECDVAVSKLKKVEQELKEILDLDVT